MSEGTGRFDGKVVVVTGGASGIGAATCHAFAREGARVAVVDINGEGAEDVATSLGRPATAHTADVTDPDAVADMAADVLDSHQRVDVLVNNAGHWARVLPFHLSAPEHWDDVVDINFRHVLLVTRAFLMSMIYIGGELSQSRLGLPTAITGVFQGVLLLALLCADTFIHYRVSWKSWKPSPR